MLTHKRLCEVLVYEKSTGLFRWRMKASKKTIVGEVAGCLTVEKSGYRRVRIRIDGRLYKAHRLAWFYETGRWPKHEIDHINGDAADNRFENLRDVPHRQNQIAMWERKKGLA
jgi:hypothetical protein